MTKFATRIVAQVPVAEGYRVRYVAASTRGAAEFRRDAEHRHGFPAEVLEVSGAEWDAILRGAWNTHKPTPGL